MSSFSQLGPPQPSSSSHDLSFPETEGVYVVVTHVHDSAISFLPVFCWPSVLDSGSALFLRRGPGRAPQCWMGPHILHPCSTCVCTPSPDSYPSFHLARGLSCSHLPSPRIKDAWPLTQTWGGVSGSSLTPRDSCSVIDPVHLLNRHATLFSVFASCLALSSSH